MTDSAVRNLATMAQMRLDRLAQPHTVAAYRVDDETVVCSVCGFTLDDGEHSAAEIRWMHELVAAHDEAQAVGPDPDCWIGRSRGRGDQADN